jgi:hypothetical protein
MIHKFLFLKLRSFRFGETFPVNSDRATVSKRLNVGPLHIIFLHITFLAESSIKSSKQWNDSGEDLRNLRNHDNHN